MACGLFYKDYVNDEQLFPTVWLKSWMIGFVLFLIIFPLFASTYMLAFLILTGIYVIGAHGISILTGFTGQISLGHGAFMAVGAYSSGILMEKFGFPFIVALPLAGVFTALVGLIFGMPALRVRGLYLALSTLAAQFIIEFALLHFKSLTGGAIGMHIPRASLAGFQFNTHLKYYYLVLAFVVLGTIFARNLIRTKCGRAFIAIRDRYLAAELIGINLFKYKLYAFFIGSFYVGIAGSLWAHYVTTLHVEQFPLALSIKYIVMIIIGGLGSVKGAIFGVIFISGLEELLAKYSGALTTIFPGVADIMLGLGSVVYGLIIILFLIFEPDGLNEMWRKLRAYWKLWPFKYKVLTK